MSELEDKQGQKILQEFQLEVRKVLLQKRELVKKARKIIEKKETLKLKKALSTEDDK